MRKHTESEFLRALKSLTKAIERIAYLIDPDIENIGDKEAITKQLHRQLASTYNQLAAMEKDLGLDIPALV